MQTLRRIPLLAILTAALMIAQALLGTLADITGDAAAHLLTTSAIGARWVRFSCPSANCANVRIGDSSVSATRGAAVTSAVPFTLPPMPTSPYPYALNKIYYYAGSGDKLQVTYGK